VLPAGISGAYYLIVKTDIDQWHNHRVSETNESNNFVFAPITITYTEPDLVFKSIVVEPASIASGGETLVTWTVRNEGTRWTTQDFWYDSVYISRDRTIDGSDISASGSHKGRLDIGADYTATAKVKMPLYAEGDYYVLLSVDNGNYVPEYFNEYNNYGEATLAVTLTPAPDLQVTSIAGLEMLLSTQKGTVEWTVRNKGTGVVMWPTSPAIPTSIPRRIIIWDRSPIATLWAQARVTPQPSRSRSRGISKAPGTSS
jgi:subtilase family serine protease